MLYTIQNQNLRVSVSDMGAELQSVQSTDGTEWLWQGDPAYWERRAPVLFPHCGRFWNNLVTAYGVPCNPGMHGFLRDQPTVAEEVSGSSIVFRQTENSETLGRYPFPYEVRICYALEEDTITVRAEIKNTGTRTMPYGYGGFRNQKHRNPHHAIRIRRASRLPRSVRGRRPGGLLHPVL